MAKQTGLGDNFYAGGYDLSGDTASVENVGGGPAALDITGINKSAMERVGGQRSGNIAWTSWFNTAAKAEHVALSPLPTTDVHVMYFRGTTLGDEAAAIVAKQVNYDPTRNADGVLQFNVDAQANAFGLEWGINLTSGITTLSSAGATTGIENVAQASSSFGLQAYLQVIGFTGTDATVIVQESSDDASGDAYANVTGGAFTEVTAAATTERIATATNLTVEQWLRTGVTTSAGFSNIQYAVMVVRNAAVPVF